MKIGVFEGSILLKINFFLKKNNYFFLNKLLFFKKINYIFLIKKNDLIIIFIIIVDWELGIGDGGLGPIPNPQSPIPKNKPQTKKENFFKKNLKKI